jgi:glutamate-ammonia-ligase adenylyltransferase
MLELGKDGTSLTTFENKKLDINKAINYAKLQSKFLSDLLTSKPDLIKSCKQNLKKDIKRSHIESFIKGRPIDNIDSLKKSLREMREHFFVISLIRDLNNLCDLSEVFDTHTNLAEIALKISYEYHLKELTKQYGRPLNEGGKKQNLIIIGMGKLGGKELNPSSDIDLVFLYDEQGQTNKKSISNQDFFTKLSKCIISTLNDFTEDGIVFRVDTRLRPFGSQGLLVLSVEAFEGYLLNQGLDWERYAWLKARIIIGPGKIVNSLIIPFVYRKYLDFNIFSSLRKIKRKINTDMQNKINDGDVKYGKGGIRTIEFIVQSYQLVWGGKDKSLRSKNFSLALNSLFEKKLIDKSLMHTLADAYSFFRNLEHRLQYINDAQTHKIPKDLDVKNLLANSMNMKNWKVLEKKMIQHQDAIEIIFRDLFNKENNQNFEFADEYELIWNFEMQKELAINFLSNNGYRKSEDTYNFLKNTKRMGLYPSLPSLSKERMDQLIPLVIAEVSKVDNPDKTIVDVLNALETIARRSSYLTLLKENKSALTLLVKIASFNQDIIEEITQYPAMIDELIDPSLFVKPFDLKELKVNLMEQLRANEGDIEEQMNLMRNFKQSMIFKLAVQEEMQIYPTEKISDALADIADLIVQEALLCVWKALYPKIRFPKLGIIAYGKFGGKEMSYLSDLDMVFVYDDSKSVSRDKLVKLTQRFNSWMTSHTASGILYDIDFRLRPDGGSGILVSSWDAFDEYQMHKAQTWENQAITRARFLSDDNFLKRKFKKLRDLILQKKRDVVKLKSDVVSMRERIYRNKKPINDLFDLKHSHGGLVDIEFITQFYILAYSYKFNALTENIGNIALLEKIASLDLLNQIDAQKLILAYREYRKIQHKQGLNSKNPGKVDLEIVSDHAINVQKIWKKFLEKNQCVIRKNND